MGRPSPKSESDQPPPVLLRQRSSVTPHPHQATPILPPVVDRALHRGHPFLAARGTRLRLRRAGARARLRRERSGAGGRGPVAEEPGTPSRGVKDDISELTETLARRF